MTDTTLVHALPLAPTSPHFTAAGEWSRQKPSSLADNLHGVLAFVTPLQATFAGLVVVVPVAAVCAPAMEQARKKQKKRKYFIDINSKVEKSFYGRNFGDVKNAVTPLLTSCPLW